jgi:hypothetical protein
MKAILDACDRHRLTPQQKDGLFWANARRVLKLVNPPAAQQRPPFSAHYNCYITAVAHGGSGVNRSPPETCRST